MDHVTEDTSLHCDIVTPERIMLSLPAQMVIVPGAEGEFGVLSGHAPFLSTLRPGVIMVQSPQNETHKIVVLSGMAEVNGTACTVLAEVARDITGLSAIEAQQALIEARSAADKAITEEQKNTAARELALAELAVRAAA